MNNIEICELMGISFCDNDGNDVTESYINSSINCDENTTFEDQEFIEWLNGMSANSWKELFHHIKSKS